MAEIRTLKLNLLADSSTFNRQMRAASKDMDAFGKGVYKVSRAAVQSFKLMAAASAALAVKIGVDSVKAAIEDQQSQAKLAKALKNTTGATQTTIAATEKWITAQQRQYGTLDSKLRPAIANLSRATGDLAKSQKLTALAMDISAATGKDLEAVSLALGKAYNGNLGALTRLGVPLDKNIIKTKDFDAASQQLTKLFAGAAQASADTYAGKMAILGQRTSELKESIGGFLLPIVGKFVDYANNSVVPTLEKIALGFSGKSDSISNKLKQVGRDMGYAPDSGAYNLGKALRDVADSFAKMFDAINGDGNKSANTLQRIADSLESIAGAIDSITKAYDKGAAILGKDSLLGKVLRWNIKDNVFGPQARATGGPVTAGRAVRVGEFGPETFVPSGSGSIRKASATGNVTININGIVDAESARRSIEKLLQDSARRTSAISLAGATL